MEEVDLDNALRVHDLNIHQHGLEDAEAMLKAERPGSADEIIAEYHARIGKPMEVNGLMNPDHIGWYIPKADAKSPRWSYAQSKLGLPQDVIDTTGRVADAILARLDDPRGESIQSRGLVLGHVQSGKTTSFLSVAAKAADDYYNLIIILAGVHNSLRRQTQERAERTLVHKRNLWWLGTAVGDFKSDGNPLSSHLSGNGKRGLLVVKKHKLILQRLANWLEEEVKGNSLDGTAILVIDDEADQAGLNVSTSGVLEGVHEQLHRIINLKTSDGKRRCSYLAYTATPYANILTSQDHYGLYPRDFIFPLDRPDSYVGAEEIFGENSIGDPIRKDDDNPDGDKLTNGLKDAIKWFVLATAARVALGSPIESFHSSMLVHTSQKTDVQETLRGKIEAYLTELSEQVATDVDSLQAFYEDVLSYVPSSANPGPDELDEPVAQWSDVAPNVATVLTRLTQRTLSAEINEEGKDLQAKSGVIIDNSQVASVDRLTYSDIRAGQPSITVIAIGGNTLSRGLTLEGLVCSYFARRSHNYDTLMQMGRWFGYRPGYRHLVRVWTTEKLLESFIELNIVEQELRAELTWMQSQGLSPNDYGPRIRKNPSLPDLQITRANAMRSATEMISYSDYQFDPSHLNLNSDAISDNQDLVRTLASSMADYKSESSRFLYYGVPIDVIEHFLNDFRFHPQESRLNRGSLAKYLAEERDSLKNWNVMFKSIKTSGAQFDYEGTVGPVGPISRSLVNKDVDGLIGSTVDSSDHRADLGNPPPPGTRYRASGEPPLLIVYAVDPASKPKNKDSGRAPLGVESHPITIAFYLPSSGTNVSYIAPKIDHRWGNDEKDEPDLGDYDDLDLGDGDDV